MTRFAKGNNSDGERKAHIYVKPIHNNHPRGRFVGDIKSQWTAILCQDDKKASAAFGDAGRQSAARGTCTVSPWAARHFDLLAHATQRGGGWLLLGPCVKP